MNARKIAYLSLFIMLGLPMAFFNGWQVINAFSKPQLVYWVEMQQVPISMRNGFINYYIKTIYFQNVGNKAANNLHVEITTRSQSQATLPEEYRETSANPNVLLQEGSKEGEVIINTAKTQYTTWGEAFEGELEGYASLADFKNKRKEGSAIIRKPHENNLVAYKERFHSGQRGYIRMSSFIKEPTFTKILFESDETTGKERAARNVLENLFTNKVFLAFLGILLIADAIYQAANALKKTDAK